MGFAVIVVIVLLTIIASGVSELADRSSGGYPPGFDPETNREIQDALNGRSPWRYPKWTDGDWEIFYGNIIVLSSEEKRKIYDVLTELWHRAVVLILGIAVLAVWVYLIARIVLVLSFLL
jgi:hypothetical protein